MSAHAIGGWIEKIPQVDIELMADGNICVTDTSCFDQNFSVVLHPIHLRLIAEKLGLTRNLSASEADALRTIDKLARRLKVLHERIYQMDRWLWEHPDATDADISIEIWYSAATLELSNEFQAEIAESRNVTPTSRQQRDSAAGSDGQNTPENGGTKHPQRRGSSAASKPSGNPDGTQRVSPPHSTPLFEGMK